MVVASAASKNSLVAMPWSLESIGTSMKDFLCVSNQVPPGGMRIVLAIAVDDEHGGTGWKINCHLQPITKQPM